LERGFVPEPSADEVRKSNMLTLADTHVVYLEAVRRKFGENGLQAVGEANRKHGLSLGKSAISNGGLRTGDLGSIFEFFKTAHPFFGFELEIEKQTEYQLDMRVTYCPWLDSFRARGARKDICKWVTLIDEGIGQAVDSSVRLTLPKCMMRGDDHCIYRFMKSSR
jgi:hypothetical protein